MDVELPAVSETRLEATPDVTALPLTVTVAFDCATVGVTVIESIAFKTDAL
jgi:hypothetical protein